jgi:hypothetical protein
VNLTGSYARTYLGFESHPLRQKSLLTNGLRWIPDSALTFALTLCSRKATEAAVGDDTAASWLTRWLTICTDLVQPGRSLLVLVRIVTAEDKTDGTGMLGWEYICAA